MILGVFRECGYCQEVCHVSIFATSDNFNTGGRKPSIITSSDRCVGYLKCFSVCLNYAITIKEDRTEQCPA
ncbi:MAG: 4Fe-4S dicluster domain-containing protein [Pseudomonadota bacterium]